MKRPYPFSRYVLLGLLCLLLLLGGCKRGGRQIRGEAAFVSAPQVNLRDRLSAIYNKAGLVKNGERVEVLEKNKRFVRVRSARGEEGWMEARHLAGPEVAEAFAQLGRENADAPAQGRGSARAELNMHVTPGRDTEHLFRLDDGAKVEILRRAVAEKPQGKAPAPTGLSKPAPKAEVKIVPPATDAPPKSAPAVPPAMEDWLLVRDVQRRVGWVLARIVDAEVPMDIAQYAEGQRIVATFVLNHATDVGEDHQTKQVPQYLVALTEPKDGQLWDYSQVRVFTWNTRRHRYETAYRERNLFGVLPITVGHQVFEREGDQPTFVLREKDPEGGAVREKLYRLSQTIVRRVATPEEEKADQERKRQRRAEARPAQGATRGKKKRR